MAILREWRAEIRREFRDEYRDYVLSTGIVAYLGTPGNLEASVAVRDVDEARSEIVTLSWWADRESIVAFAGPDIERAVYYPEDDRYLLTRPDVVRHFNATVPNLDA